MQAILDALQETSGVNASMVFDGGGRLALHKGHAVYDRLLCEQVCGVLVKVIDSVQLQQEDWDSLTAQFTDGKILLRNLGSQHFLAVVADTALSNSFGTVALRIAVNKLKKGMGQSPAVGLPPSSPPQRASAPPPDAAIAPFLVRCVKELAGYVGPMSKVYVREAVDRISQSGPLTMAATGRLVDALVEQLENPADRAALRVALAKEAE